MLQSIGRKSAVYPLNYCFEDFRRDGLLDLPVFRERTGSTVLEQVVDAFYCLDVILRAGRQALAQRSQIAFGQSMHKV